jgi:hypothetical protein
MASILFFYFNCHFSVSHLHLISVLVLFIMPSIYSSKRNPMFLGKQKTPVECELVNRFGTPAGDASGPEKQ